jgi:hypothetical protein
MTSHIRIRRGIISDGLLIPVNVHLTGENDFYESNINELPDVICYHTTDEGSTVIICKDMVIVGSSIDFDFD